MTRLAGILVIGFVLGLRHATDADHVVAISTIVARRRGVASAAAIGFLWGLGHTFTILVVGTAIILFSIAIPVRLGLSMELSVGVMLVLLGVMNLSGLTHRVFHYFSSREGEHSEHPSPLLHSHEHSHGEMRHSHTHVHLLAGHRHQGLRLNTFEALRPVAVGIVHGLAGSAAIALLVLTTIHNPLWSMIYLLVFGAGTIGGMILITIGMAVPFTMPRLNSTNIERTLVIASGLLSLGFGMFIVYHIGFVDGLFSQTPKWTPH